MTPWYLESGPLARISAMLRNPPRRQFTRSTWSRNFHDGSNDYVGHDVDALRADFEVAFGKIDSIRPWPREAVESLMKDSADEVLAALFGCPNGLEWAFPETVAHRAIIRANIEAATRAEAA